MPNRLASETSPYLRQHAENPVDWYPWGPAALARSKAENKPILLSIGYAACHWCHVMAHESFENDTTAALMNELFVNIKVDREERPDLDSIYMQAVQAMTGQGGWPMTVFLTPAGEPFWGGTYFPPDERMGMPSFRRVLTAVSDAYASKPEQIAKSTSAMRDLYRSAAETVPSGTVSAETLRRAADVATRTYDPRHGGFGGAPKFPPTMLLEFLLAHWARTGDRQSLTIAHDTFASMAAGGIHDQIGGGIHRYAVDAHWLVPHFEKMLYDNALLARFGAHLWQATHDDAVRRVTERLLRWVATEMTSPDSGFYASLDADSEGHEGIFYTWTEAELRDVLGDDARPIIEWFGVTAGGNFEGRNILHLPGGINVAEPPELERAMRLLYAVRSARVWPGLDDKIIASWNGLMLRGVATCARVFQSEEWRAFSVRQAECMLRKLVSGETVSRLVPRDGKSVPGFLEDHAAVALGFLEVWQLTGDRAWLDHARALARGIAARFWDESIPGFYDVPVDHEALITRPRDLYDNAMPSGSSMAIELFLRLGYITGDETLTQRGEAALRPHTETLARYPQAFGHLLGAADMAVHGMTAVVIVGAEPAATESLRSAASERFLPSGIVAATTVGENADLDLFRDRGARGAAAAYVCRGRVCDAPACTPAELMEQLAGAPLGGTGE